MSEPWKERPIVLFGHDPKSPHLTGEQALAEIRRISDDGTVSFAELQEALRKQCPGSVS